MISKILAIFIKNKPRFVEFKETPKMIDTNKASHFPH